MPLPASQMTYMWTFQCMENDDEQLPLILDSGWGYLLFSEIEEGSLDRGDEAE